MQTLIPNPPNLTNAEATANIFLLAYQALPPETQRIIFNRIRLNEFWGNKSIDELARSQGVTPIENIDDLKGNFWPADEPVDEILETIRGWRDAGIISES